MKQEGPWRRRPARAQPSMASLLQQSRSMNRPGRVVIMALTVLIPALTRASANDEAAAPSVVAVRVVSDAGEVHGAATLIRRDDVQDRATLYFLTSARLFRGPHGDRQHVSNIVELRLNETRTIEVKRGDVFSTGDFLDVAVLRAVVSDPPALRPRLLVYDPPAIGDVFLLSGIGKAGDGRTIAEHVRFESTLLVVGDSDASELADCVGAPAIAPDGVFGIVRECEAHRPPVVSLLSMAHAFLDRYVPRQTTAARSTPQFERRSRALRATSGLPPRSVPDLYVCALPSRRCRERAGNSEESDS